MGWDGVERLRITWGMREEKNKKRERGWELADSLYLHYLLIARSHAFSHPLSPPVDRPDQQIPCSYIFMPSPSRDPFIYRY